MSDQKLFNEETFIVMSEIMPLVIARLRNKRSLVREFVIKNKEGSRCNLQSLLIWCTTLYQPHKSFEHSSYNSQFDSNIRHSSKLAALAKSNLQQKAFRF